MKIKKVKWEKHPILGDLKLDFTNVETGEPFETVLFAGENGNGKTTILESISTFLNRGSFEYFEYIEYIVDNKTLKAIPSKKSSIKEFYDVLDEGGNVTRMHTNKNNIDPAVDENILNIRFHGCVFSKARADYKTQRIKSTTTKRLDVDKYDIDEEDDFTALKQLIVDVQNQDNSDYYDANKELGSNPIPWNEFYQTSKVYRFKRAFDNFFEKIKYDRVADANSEKSILFKKNNKSIPIDQLSTGEKQIVFRGIFLLKNSKNLDGAAIMIDEPELSLHPKWQQNILYYYKDLFTEARNQKTQIFIATHSEHVLKAALLNKDKNLVIILNDIGGVVTARRIDVPAVLPSITSAETNFIAFDVVSNDYHIELYGWLQQKESKTSVKACDDYIKASSHYNSSIHSKPSSHRTTTYDTLTTYIRNAIDHPDSTRTFTELELRTSIELLIKLIN